MSTDKTRMMLQLRSLIRRSGELELSLASVVVNAGSSAAAQALLGKTVRERSLFGRGTATGRDSGLWQACNG